MASRLFLAAAALAGCSSADLALEPAAPPSVFVEAEGEAEPEAVEPTAFPVKCSLQADAWVHAPVALHHQRLADFARVARGRAALRLDGDWLTGALSLAVDGWRLDGLIVLAELDVFTAAPRWFGDAVRPRAGQALHLEPGSSALTLRGSVDIAPHFLTKEGESSLELPVANVGCRDIALTPRADEPLGVDSQGAAIDGKPVWTVLDGARFEVGGLEGRPLATLTLQGITTVRELARAPGRHGSAERCWVLLQTPEAALTGWLRCDKLVPHIDRLGRSHRTRGPRVRSSHATAGALVCGHELALLARRGERTVHVGAIDAGVAVRVTSELDDGLALWPPAGVSPGDDVTFVVAKEDSAKGCSLTPP